MIRYDKLMRDRIPEIIEAEGKRCTVRILEEDEYRRRLDAKLEEELAEYRESGEIEELADIAELIRAIVISRGMTPEAFEVLRQQKEMRGVASLTGCSWNRSTTMPDAIWDQRPLLTMTWSAPAQSTSGMVSRLKQGVRDVHSGRRTARDDAPVRASHAGTVAGIRRGTGGGKCGTG